MFKITGLCRGRLYRALPCRHCVGAGTGRIYAGVYRIDAGMYLSLYLPIYRISAVDLVMDLVETTIFLSDILGGIFSYFLLFSSLRLFLWIFVDVDASAIKLIMIWKSKKCFSIGSRISPGSTGVYRVDAGSAVSAPGYTVLAPGCAGLYRVHAGVTAGSAVLALC